MKLKIKEHPDFVRDTESGAIINTSIGKYNEYLKSKQLEKDVLTLKSDIMELKDNINIIKELLLGIKNDNK